MIAHTTASSDADYQRLLSEFPPRIIQDKGDLERVEAKVDALLALEQRTSAQEVFLDLLATLIEVWENENIVIPQMDGVELLKALCQERRIRQKDLVPIFGAESIVSEVFAGKRRLQTKHITALAEFFHVSPAAFLPAAESIGKVRQSEPLLAR